MDFIKDLHKKIEKANEEINLLSDEKIIKVDPEEISNWELRDRQAFEVGDIDALAASIKRSGQAQPIILVKSGEVFKSKDNSKTKYIVVAGYRRWLACMKHDIRVEAVVREMTLEQAIGCLVAENEKEPVSDYSKGLFFQDILDREKITQKELCSRLNLKDSTLRNFLSFNEVPKEIWDAVTDLSVVSARTSAEIKLIARKGDEYIQALISIADHISQGVGAKVINKLVAKVLDSENKRKKEPSIIKEIKGKYKLEIGNKYIKVSANKGNTEQYKQIASQIEELLVGL